MDSPMSVPPLVPPPAAKKALGADADIYARIEGLLGQEDALLRIPANQRTQDDQDRLRVIGQELDRIFERLRERVELKRRREAEEPGPA
jgi:hypothetical protein